ncbi:MAG: putative oxygen-independent coproporphyrinogen III oxidase [Gammaproteobacteria bacterium]|jgi:putative oxygen-independent coproporphyrinogen III oxidase
MLDFKSNPPLSLYIHLPWCIKKCPYCDFNSHAINKEAFPEDAYIDALISDLESELPRIWGRPIVSIFIGGGTPSLFSAEAIDRLMAALRSRLTFYHNTEVTMEANPGSAEAGRFKAYRESGVNRLSIGVQSFDDKKLKLLGRVHNSTEALNAVAMAKSAGFDEINIDLMFGLPDQSIEEALSDLEIAIELQPTHLSWYQLTIEPNTVFYSKPPVLPVDDLLWDMQEQGQAYLSDNGFNQYEISAYARNGDSHQCQHNRNYWQFGDYLGIGAGAHGKLTHVAEGKIERYARHRIPQSYVEKISQSSAVTETRSLTRDELPLEFMMNVLRLNDGFHPSLFSEHTGLLLNAIKKPLEIAEEKALIEWVLNKIKPTETGHRYLNDLLQLFMK